MSLKQSVKRFGCLVGLVRAARAGVLDAQQVYWSAIRGGKIRSYLAAHSVRKLHIGASNSLLPGWLNTDFILEKPEVVYLDATQRFPFPDAAFDYITCEHMIEHIDYAGAEVMLSECFRVLKPGGKIRVSTPDLQMIGSLCAAEKSAEQNSYIDFIVQRVMPEVKNCKGVFVVNNAFRAWGHQFLYDRPTLRHTLEKHGFKSLQDYKPGMSDDENLRGLEAHGKTIGNEAINQFETIVVEASRPA
jgi:predicted SAM-dependent methyltransferase